MNAQLWLLNETSSRFLSMTLLNCSFKKAPQYPANTSTLNQHWNNVDRQRSSTLFQGWYLVENESWVDVHFSTLFRRWENNVETTSIKLRRFNVDYQTFQRWYLIENESWTDVCLSTLFQRCFVNVFHRITSIQRWWFNVA